MNKGNDNFDRKVSINSLSVEEFRVVELKIIQAYQNIYFENEIKVLKGITNHKMLERTRSLNPSIDSYGILRAGVRLEKSTLDESVTHPIILPKSGKVTDLLIRWCHQKTAHNGKNIPLNENRSSGYWVMQGSSAVKKVISRCVTCRRLRGRVGEQIMAGLYGALFTCLASRVIHIEKIKNMDTDCFILALRRFIGRRGNIRTIYVTMEGILWELREQAKCWKEVKHKKLVGFMLKNSTDWIQ